jgi:hypothetical protein
MGEEERSQSAECPALARKAESGLGVLEYSRSSNLNIIN